MNSIQGNGSTLHVVGECVNRIGKKQPLAVAISAIIFVTLYTLIGGFGFANGGSLRFMLAFTIGAPASLVVTVLFLIGISRSR